MRSSVIRWEQVAQCFQQLGPENLQGWWLHSLFGQYLAVLMVQMLFLVASLNLFHFNLCPLSLVFPPCTMVKSLAPSSWSPACKKCQAVVCPSQSRVFSSPVPSASSHRALALSCLGGLCWTCSNVPTYFLHWVQYSGVIWVPREGGYSHLSTSWLRPC